MLDGSTSIIILTCNKLAYTKLCIDSIRRYTDRHSYELIVVDNHSTDGSVEWLKQQADIRVIYNGENLGFPKGCNQGMAAATGGNILLVNNDVIVAQHWLAKLLNCLHSSEEIGAVGPVTNNCSNYQAIPAPYQSAAQMRKFADEYNVSHQELWEERLKLAGFCLLIKRKVVNQIGPLDEIFTPGNFEADDYSVRIRRAGYRLMLCRDTFVHHFGGVSFRDNQAEYAALLLENCRKFERKWGYDPHYAMNIREDIINLMDAPLDEPIRVLDVGCGCGGTLLQIKNKYRQANVYGIEVNADAARDAALFAEVAAADVERAGLNYPERFFHYIILANVLECLRNPWSVLERLYKHLAPGGQMLAIVPNAMHFRVIRNLLSGHWLDETAGFCNKTQLRFFTFNELHKMFTDTGFSKLEYRASLLRGSEQDQEFVNGLIQLGDPAIRDQYIVHQYIIKAAKGFPLNDLPGIVLAIEQGDNSAETIACLGGYPPAAVLQVIDTMANDKKELLKIIARTGNDKLNHPDQAYQHASPYWQAVLAIDANDAEALYQLGRLHYLLREYDTALSYLGRIADSDQQVALLLARLHIERQSRRPVRRWVTLFPEAENVHLAKDVGMLAFVMQKHFGYDSILACYRNGEYPYLNREVSGLKLDFLRRRQGALQDGCDYLREYAKAIDVLHVFHLEERTLHWILLYKALNPQGKVYLKLDANIFTANVQLHESVVRVLQQCDLISVETIRLHQYLNTAWPAPVEYIPNGFYDFDQVRRTEWEEKENSICTVGRIGAPVKANEVLLAAFRLAAPAIPNWKLKLIGPVDRRFQSDINAYFAQNPELRERVIFTGEISDKRILAEEYRKAKIFCLTSIVESFGLVLVEAIKHGCFIITTNVVSAPDITDQGRFGDIFEVGDVEQLADYLIADCNNEERLRSVCSLMQDFAYDHFQWLTICRRIDQCLLNRYGCYSENQ